MTEFSMEGYFGFVKEKSYIDRYPEMIIRLDELDGKILVEFGAGAGNDARFLIESKKIEPGNICIVEPDLNRLVEGLDRMQGCDRCSYYLAPECPPEIACKSIPRVLSGDILHSGLGDCLADFVYANNCLHCLGYSNDLLERKTSNKIKEALAEVHRILKPEGVFFGRTLLDEINQHNLEVLEKKKIRDEKEQFALDTAIALMRGELIGVSTKEFGDWASDAGFESVHTEAKFPCWKATTDFYFRLEKGNQ